MRASHIKTFRGHGSFISSNLVGETHVPRNAPGTPQANARFRPPRTHARSADESEESGGACTRGRARAGAGRARCASIVRLRETAASGPGKQGLGRAGWARGEREREVPGQANAPLAPGRSGCPSGTLPAPGENGPRPPGNQRCDPAGPAAVAEMPGPIRWDTDPSWSPHNPRTPACA